MEQRKNEDFVESCSRRLQNDPELRQQFNAVGLGPSDPGWTAAVERLCKAETARQLRENGWQVRECAEEAEAEAGKRFDSEPNVRRAYGYMPNNPQSPEWKTARPGTLRRREGVLIPRSPRRLDGHMGTMPAARWPASAGRFYFVADQELNHARARQTRTGQANDQQRSIMAVVKFQLETEEAKAVQGFLKLVDAQKKAEKGLGDIHTAGKQARETLESIGNTLANGLAGIASLGTMKEALSGIADNYKKMSDSNVGFQDSLTPLASMASTSRELRQMADDVLAFSSSGVAATDDIVATFAELKGQTGDLSSEIRNDLLKSGVELHTVLGGQLRADVDLLAKTYRSYGQELGTVENVESKLMYLHQQTGISVDALADGFPKLMLAGRATGASFDDLAGELIALTRVSGSGEDAMEGLQRLLLVLEKSSARTGDHVGDLVDRIKGLEDAEPETLEKLFSSKVLGNADAMVRLTNQIRENITEIGKVKPDFGKGQLELRQDNPQFASSELIKGFRGIAANADAIKAQDASYLVTQEINEGIMTGAQLSSGPLVPPEIWKASAYAEFAKRDKSEYFQLALKKHISDLQQTHQDAAIDQLEFEFGDASGTMIADPDADASDKYDVQTDVHERVRDLGKSYQRPLNEGDRQKYREVLATIAPHMTRNQFLNYRQKELAVEYADNEFKVDFQSPEISPQEEARILKYRDSLDHSAADSYAKQTELDYNRKNSTFWSDTASAGSDIAAKISAAISTAMAPALSRFEAAARAHINAADSLSRAAAGKAVNKDKLGGALRE